MGRILRIGVSEGPLGDRRRGSRGRGLPFRLPPRLALSTTDRAGRGRAKGGAGGGRRVGLAEARRGSPPRPPRLPGSGRPGPPSIPDEPAPRDLGWNGPVSRRRSTNRRIHGWPTVMSSASSARVSRTLEAGPLHSRGAPLQDRARPVNARRHLQTRPIPCHGRTRVEAARAPVGVSSSHTGPAGRGGSTGGEPAVSFDGRRTSLAQAERGRPARRSARRSSSGPPAWSGGGPSRPPGRAGGPPPARTPISR